MSKRATQLLALVCLFGMLAAACGQKPGVHLATRSAGTSAGEEPAGGEELGAGPQGAAAGSTGAGGRTARSSGGASGGGSVAGGTASSDGATAPSRVIPGDKDGVFPDKVLIGLHAPLTGAAPVPLTDLKAGTTIYDRWLASKGVKTNGRRIQIDFLDDQYSPSRAVEVCREFVEKKKYFMLIGGAGTDQIMACARYSATKAVPYLSLGVTENIVKGYRNYFAVSASYPQQTKPLAEMIYRYDPGPDLGGKIYADRCADGAASQTSAFCATTGANTPKVAIVYSNTDGFFDARDRFLQEWKSVSGANAMAFSITKFAIDAGAARSLVQQLKPGGFDVVFILTSPTNWTSITREAEGQQYAPRWVGVGLTKAINPVAATGCGQSPNNFRHSLFLNPWPSVDGNLTPQFADAWSQFGDGTPFTQHDIAFGLWGLSVSVESLLLAVGQDLTRSKFISTVETLKNVKAPSFPQTGQVTQVFSGLSYSPNDHFGAGQAHLLRGDCAPKPAWFDVAGKQFVTGF